MSEVLRAVFDHNCLDSRVAFYTARISVVCPGGGLAITRRQATLPCKADTWFLAMGAAQDSSFIDVGNSNAWTSKSFPTTFQIVRASTGEAFSISPQLATLQNYNLNNWVTWDEYIPFAPAELIQFNMDVRTNSATAGLLSDTFVTLMGVEYQMPAGREQPYGY